MQWFRMYHDVVHDPKIQRLSIELRWRWVELLCIASKADERGRLPGIDDCAYLMRLTSVKAKQIIDTMIESGLIDVSDDGNSLAIHGWESRQKPGDSSKKRVEEWRKRHKDDDQGGSVSDTVTLQKHAPRARSRDTDSETETDSEQSAPAPLRPVEDPEGIEPFHPPPILVNPSDSGGREGDDLADWRAAIEILRDDEDTAPLAEDMGMRAETREVRAHEGWRFVCAARAVRQPGMPTGWSYFLACVRNASRREFEARGRTRTDRPRQRAEPEPRRLPPVPADSPLWKLSERLDVRLDRHAQ